MEILAKLILFALFSPVLLLSCVLIANRSRPLAALVALTATLGAATLCVYR